MTAPSDPVPPASLPSGWKLPRLRITRDGEWLHEDEEVTHPGILANLRENLRVDADGHYLQVGPARVPVEVDDAPFVVVRVAPDGEDLAVTLNDLTREPLAAETLGFDPGGVPHCRVKGGRFSARLSRAATYQLFERIEYDEREGRATLVIGPRRYPLTLPGSASPAS